jgi:hypothetical protein
MARQNEWNIILVTSISVVVMVGGYLLLQAAFTQSARQRETQGPMF